MDLFSNLQIAGECLLDQKRTRAFLRAIELVVTSRSRVLDAGTGSGILALGAARAGAAKVYAVEIAPEVAKMAAASFAANGFDITLYQADMKDFEMEEQVDVVTMEMLDTGLIAEQQCQGINALHAHGIVRDDTVFIPSQVESFIQLIEYDFNFDGFEMPCIIQARNNGVMRRVVGRRSELVSYDRVDFREPVEEQVDVCVDAKIKESGTVNALMLRSKIRLNETVALWQTTDMNMPVIIPVGPFQTQQGDHRRVGIRYKRGYGFDCTNLSVSVCGSQI